MHFELREEKLEHTTRDGSHAVPTHQVAQQISGACYIPEGNEVQNHVVSQPIRSQRDDEAGNNIQVVVTLRYRECIVVK